MAYKANIRGNNRYIKTAKYILKSNPYATIDNIAYRYKLCIYTFSASLIK